MAAVRPRKSGRGAEQSRAPRLLAGSPLGCTEAILLAHGFTVEILRCMVLDGVATATPGTVQAGAGPATPRLSCAVGHNAMPPSTRWACPVM
jgi:hypothetical protein